MVCLSPQMALFYLTIVPQTGFFHLSPWLGVLLVGLIHFTIRLAWYLLLIFLTQPLARFLNHIRVQREMKLISGLMLILMSGSILIG